MNDSASAFDPVDPMPSSATRVASALAATIDRFGPSLFYEPERLKALLHQACPDAPRGIALIMAALTEDVPQRLLAPHNDDDLQRTLPALVERLVKNSVFDPRTAHWVVRAWADALALPVTGLDAQPDAPLPPAAPVPSTHFASVVTPLATGVPAMPPGSASLAAAPPESPVVEAPVAASSVEPVVDTPIEPTPAAASIVVPEPVAPPAVVVAAPTEPEPPAIVTMSEPVAVPVASRAAAPIAPPIEAPIARPIAPPIAPSISPSTAPPVVPAWAAVPPEAERPKRSVGRPMLAVGAIAFAVAAVGLMLRANGVFDRPPPAASGVAPSEPAPVATAVPIEPPAAAPVAGVASPAESAPAATAVTSTPAPVVPAAAPSVAPEPAPAPAAAPAVTATIAAGEPPSITRVEVPRLVAGKPFVITIAASGDPDEIGAIERKVIDDKGSASEPTVIPAEGLKRTAAGALLLPFDAIASPSRATLRVALVDQAGRRSPWKLVDLQVGADAPVAVPAPAPAAPTVACTSATCGSVVSVRPLDGERAFEVIFRMDDRTIRTSRETTRWRVGARARHAGTRFVALAAEQPKSKVKAKERVARPDAIFESLISKP